jgi:multiple sugar transport system permease protein
MRRRAPTRSRGLQRREAIDGYLFISPWIGGFVCLGLGPYLFAVVLSLCRWDMMQPMEFVGLANYRAMVIEDPLFWKSLANTFVYVLLSVPAGLAVALGLALLLNRPVRGVWVFRTIFYLPAVLSGVAVLLLWKWIFNADFGLLNAFLMQLGLDDPPAWLASTKWAKPALAIMSLWGVGGAMLIFLAGLQGIPSSLYEAARLDGAGRVKRFLHVTLPMLSPVMFFNLVMGFIVGFQAFLQPYVMTRGGPQDATMFYVLHLFLQAFRYFRMGYASALAWVLFIVILGVTALNFRIAKHWVYYEHE